MNPDKTESIKTPIPSTDATPFPWKEFAQNHPELHLDRTFWTFWENYFLGTDVQRTAWERQDHNFEAHLIQLRSLLTAARSFSENEKKRQ
jgi:hypothetical protein